MSIFCLTKEKNCNSFGTSYESEPLLYDIKKAKAYH